MTKVALQGADIELIERSAEASPIVVPNTLRINGVEMLIPQDADIRISEINPCSLVTVTLTIVARSVSIRHEAAEEP